MAFWETMQRGFGDLWNDPIGTSRRVVGLPASTTATAPPPAKTIEGDYYTPDLGVPDANVQFNRHLDENFQREALGLAPLREPETPAILVQLPEVSKSQLDAYHRKRAGAPPEGGNSAGRDISPADAEAALRRALRLPAADYVPPTIVRADPKRGGAPPEGGSSSGVSEGSFAGRESRYRPPGGSGVIEGSFGGGYTPPVTYREPSPRPDHLFPGETERRPEPSDIRLTPLPSGTARQVIHQPPVEQMPLFTPQPFRGPTAQQNVLNRFMPETRSLPFESFLTGGGMGALGDFSGLPDNYIMTVLQQAYPNMQTEQIIAAANIVTKAQADTRRMTKAQKQAYLRKMDPLDRQVLADFGRQLEAQNPDTDIKVVPPQTVPMPPDVMPDTGAGF